MLSKTNTEKDIKEETYLSVKAGKNNSITSKKILENMRILENIVNNPVPNRNIHDYE